MKAPLSVTHAKLVEEWHPEKNGSLTADDVTAGSGRTVVWRCQVDPSHEWPAKVYNRTNSSNPTGCPICSGRSATRTTSLVAIHPDIAKEWHPTKNERTVDEVVAGSHELAWWKCPEGPDHEWEASIKNRTRGGTGCSYCNGKKPSVTNRLDILYPELAKEWHPTKNGDLTPDQVVAGSNKKRWWKCPEGPDHEWQAIVADRTRSGHGCPACRGVQLSVTNRLDVLHPEIAKEWHPTKNGFTADQVQARSTTEAWWQCSKDPTHEWKTRIRQRTLRGAGCPDCRNRRVTDTNSLLAKCPEIAEQWHPTKNRDLTPYDVVAGSGTKVWWKCPEGPDHEWQARVVERTQGKGCPYCRGLHPSVTNRLDVLHPEIAKEWHPTKNERTVNQVVAGSGKPAWWQCSKDPSHPAWKATVADRTHQGTGCPVCNKGWTPEVVRSFVSSLRNHLAAFTPAELYLLFQQSGLLRTKGKSRSFVKALVTGRFPQEEIEKFVEGTSSLVDDFVQNPAQTLEGYEGEDKRLESEDSAENIDGIIGNVIRSADDDIDDEAQKTLDGRKDAYLQELPVVETKEALSALDYAAVYSADEEAIEFLLASATQKIWKHAFHCEHCEEAAVAQAEGFRGSEYAERVRERFLKEYRKAKELRIPEGYNFRLAGDGELTQPNLMQRLIATRVETAKRVGNWSGTGAGKTLSAVLATRIVGSALTVICCPNSVVEGWQREIRGIFPDSLVEIKTFEPEWPRAADDDIGFGAISDEEAPRYLILNYEAFQQSESAQWVRSLVEREQIDFIVVDEIHYTKQRTFENISRRRQLVTALTTLAAERNSHLHFLGMSATPVINNLQEGKSLVELVTGLAHNDLDTRPTVPNCMSLYQRLVSLGIRWMPEYDDLQYEELPVEVDCGDYVDEIRTLGRGSTPLDLEQILTRARLPVIREQVESKTLIYTHYIKGIDRILREALEEDGWKVGFYTGEDKTGLNGFLEGDVDVLIGSSAVGTGVDRLQQVCNRLIVNVLLWTAAEFEQLKGRIYRQGQRKDRVTTIIPLTFAQVGGVRWSWCESKMQRLKFKRSIADAAVDGAVPEGQLRSPAQAYQDVMGWLERLETGEPQVITRPKIRVPLPQTDATDVERRQRRYGDLSRMNRTWNQSRSETTNQRLLENPEEWAQYHTLYREARKEWSVIPYEEMIRWCKKRSGYVIGDFGCGEAELAEAMSDRHTVYSFDHVAVNDRVVACDMAHVPVDDETLDVAIFSLSLMGANFVDYLEEAYRTLKLDGQLHIIEATSRFTDRGRFVRALEGLGFNVFPAQDLWKFTHIRAQKSDREPRDGVEIRF